MTPDVAVLAAAVALMFGYGPAFCAVARWRNRRKPAAAPVVVGLSTAEWDELTALQDRARADFERTPIYDRMVCEEIERAEGWA